MFSAFYFMINENGWFEVWYVDGIDHVPAYLVVVTPNPEVQNEIIVKDLDKREILFRSQSYEEVRLWLLEDDFSFVQGRTHGLYG